MQFLGLELRNLQLRECQDAMLFKIWKYYRRKAFGIFIFGPTLTDVGCTFKLFNKECADIIINQCKVQGSALQPELMINLIKSKKILLKFH